MVAGDYQQAQQARQLQTDTLTRIRRVLGEDHHTHTALSQPPRPHPGIPGRAPAGPHALQSDTFTRSRRVLGEDHPDTLRSASLLGLTLGALGEHQQARQLQNDTLTRLRRVLNHPNPPNPPNNPAPHLGARGEHAQAGAAGGVRAGRAAKPLGGRGARGLSGTGTDPPRDGATECPLHPRSRTSRQPIFVPNTTRS